MDWGGCEQHLCLLAVGLKYQAQGKIHCHPPLKYLDVKERKEGDPGRAAPRTWLPLHIGEGLSFPKAARVFLSLGWRQYCLQN